VGLSFIGPVLLALVMRLLVTTDPRDDLFDMADLYAIAAPHRDAELVHRTPEHDVRVYRTVAPSTF
jgi:hypothetical protein